MSKHIIIKGADLTYFESLVKSAISGELGELSEVRVVVSDDNRLSFGTNGFVSQEFGFDADAICTECGHIQE